MNIRKDSGPLKWILIGISVLFLFVMLILPLSYVMYTAFSKGIKVFLAAVTDKYALHSIKLTIEVSLIAVVCNTFFGIFASWLITKFQFKGKKIISTLIDLPLTVSPIIEGLIYVLTFGRQSFIYPYLKAMGIRIIFAVPGIVLATIFVTFPFISRELIPVLTSQGTDEEEAAALMGANGWTIFWKVTFPHIKWAASLRYCTVYSESYGGVWKRYPFFQDICAEELTRCRCILNFCIRDMILRSICSVSNSCADGGYYTGASKCT